MTVDGVGVGASSESDVDESGCPGGRAYVGDGEHGRCMRSDNPEGPAYGEVGTPPSMLPLMFEVEGWEREGGAGKRSRSENLTGVRNVVGLNEAVDTGTRESSEGE